MVMNIDRNEMEQTSKGKKIYNLSRSIEQQEYPCAISFSKDNTKIAVADDAEAVIYDLSSGRKIHSIENFEGRANSISFSPDFSRVAFGGINEYKELKIFDIATKEELSEVPETHGVQLVAFSHDGKRLAVAGSRDSNVFGKGLVYIYDIKSGRELLSFPREKVKTMEFSHNGNHLFVGGYNHRAVIYNLQDEQVLHTFKREDKVMTAAFSRDDAKLAVAGRGKNFNGNIRIYDFKTGAKLQTFRHERFVKSVAFSCDGKNVLAFDCKNVIMWDVRTGEKIQTSLYQSFADTVGFSSDGRKLAFGIGPNITQIYTESKWLAIKDFIFLRKLVEDGRAHAIPLKKNKADQVFQHLITAMNSDIFLFVLSFL